MLKPINDDHQLAEWIDLRNRLQQYGFMETAYQLWLDQDKPHVTRRFLCKLNFYAVHLLQPYPGVMRNEIKQNVDITNTPHTPPDWSDVETHMNNFFVTNEKMFEDNDPLEHAAFILWRLNWIHPFLQGNGRTSRALCYFIVCQRFGYWLPGTNILPELIKNTRDEYCNLLRQADVEIDTDGMTNLAPLSDYLERLLVLQLQSVGK